MKASGLWSPTLQPTPTYSKVVLQNDEDIDASTNLPIPYPLFPLLHLIHIYSTDISDSASENEARFYHICSCIRSLYIGLPLPYI